MSTPIAVPLIMGTDGSGPQPTPPATLQQTLITNVAAVQPGYTANLPGTLIDDIVSTDVGALVTMDQARVDAVNGVSPLSANAYLLGLQGQQFGIAQGAANNTSVYVVFSGLAGAVIPQGTIVSDGTYQYATQSATVIASGGSSASVLAVATQTGSWAVAASTVTTVVTVFPSSYKLTVTNPASGTPGTAAQTTESYRAQVFQNFNRVAQGVPGYIVTNLVNVPGVNPALVSVQAVSGGWKVLCAGGDPTAMAGAIYLSVLDLSTILGSTNSGTTNTTVTITDGSNSFDVIFATPVQNVVTMGVTWNTNLTNFTGGALINAAAQPAITAYINALGVNQPINYGSVQTAFVNAVAGIIAQENISEFAITMTINGSSASPSTGLQIVPPLNSDGYFYAASNAVTVSQA